MKAYMIIRFYDGSRKWKMEVIWKNIHLVSKQNFPKN